MRKDDDDLKTLKKLKKQKLKLNSRLVRKRKLRLNTERAEREEWYKHWLKNITIGDKRQLLKVVSVSNKRRMHSRTSS